VTFAEYKRCFKTI